MPILSPILFPLLYTILKNDSALWKKFEENVRYKNRFFPITDKKFFNALNKICKNTSVIRKEKTFFRARQMDIENIEDFNILKNKKIKGYLQKDINIPPKEKAAAGRANPQNVPYLYLASNKQTACAECRCSLMDILSIMEFKITQDITVIDLTKDNVHFRGLDSIFFNRIKKSFIENCTNKSDVFYAPTQYIASYFYNLGINGIKYLTARESNNESYNLLLFANDCVKAKSKRASIYICTKSSFILNEINLPNDDKIEINGNMINGQKNATQQKDEINKKILGIRQVIELKKRNEQ